MNEKNVYMFTIATLTGHACLAAGDGYSVSKIIYHLPLFPILMNLLFCA